MVVTYKDKFNKKYGFSKDTSHSLPEIAKITGYKLSGLKTIYSKGLGAYSSNRASVRPNVTSAQQWASARVLASVSPGSKSSVVDKKHLIKFV